MFNGCRRGLSKPSADKEEFSYDSTPIRRAVAFASRIAHSKALERGLPEVVESASSAHIKGVDVDAKHVDGTMGAIERDRSTIVVNDYVTLSGIPEAAHRYEVNGRSAIEWIIDRYQINVDKDSRLVNDPNTWSNNPRYIVDLIARIVHVSIETVEIVDSLPGLGL